MAQVYLGTLSKAEPLHQFLRELLKLKSPHFETYQIRPNNRIVAVRDNCTGRTVACKFFGRGDWGAPAACMHCEDSSLQRIRMLGLDLPPWRGVRVLGRCPELESLLVEEFIAGPTLEQLLRQSWKSRSERDSCHHWLRLVGGFLSDLHHRSLGDPLDFSEQVVSLRARMERLELESVAFPPELAGRLRQALQRIQGWRTVRASVLQGDCSPTNYIFSGYGELVAVDFKSSLASDPMRDLGELEAHLHLAASSQCGDWRACRPDVEMLRQAYGPYDPGRLALWRGFALLEHIPSYRYTPGQRHQILEEVLRCLSL